MNHGLDSIGNYRLPFFMVAVSAASVYLIRDGYRYWFKSDRSDTSVFSSWALIFGLMGLIIAVLGWYRYLFQD